MAEPVKHRIKEKKIEKEHAIEKFTDILNIFYDNENTIEDFKYKFSAWSNAFLSENKLFESLKSQAIVHVQLSRISQVLITAIVSICILETYTKFEKSFAYLGLTLYLSVITMNLASNVIIAYRNSQNEYISEVKQYFESVYAMFQLFKIRLDVLRRRCNWDIKVDSVPSGVEHEYPNQDISYSRLCSSAFHLYNMYGIAVGFIIFLLCWRLKYEIFEILEIFTICLLFAIAVAKDIKIRKLHGRLQESTKFMKIVTIDFLTWFENNCEICEILKQYQVSNTITDLFLKRTLSICRKPRYLNFAISITECDVLAGLNISRNDFKNALMFLAYGKYFVLDKLTVKTINTQMVKQPCKKKTANKRCQLSCADDLSRNLDHSKELPEYIEINRCRIVDDNAKQITSETKSNVHFTNEDSKIYSKHINDKGTSTPFNFTKEASNVSFSSLKHESKEKSFDENLSLRKELRKIESEKEAISGSEIKCSDVDEMDMESICSCTLLTGDNRQKSCNRILFCKTCADIMYCNVALPAVSAKELCQNKVDLGESEKSYSNVDESGRKSICNDTFDGEDIGEKTFHRSLLCKQCFDIVNRNSTLPTMPENTICQNKVELDENIGKHLTKEPEICCNTDGLFVSEDNDTYLRNSGHKTNESAVNNFNKRVVITEDEHSCESTNSSSTTETANFNELVANDFNEINYSNLHEQATSNTKQKDESEIIHKDVILNVKSSKPVKVNVKSFIMDDACLSKKESDHTLTETKNHVDENETLKRQFNVGISSDKQEKGTRINSIETFHSDHMNLAEKSQARSNTDESFENSFSENSESDSDKEEENCFANEGIISQISGDAINNERYDTEIYLRRSNAFENELNEISDSGLFELRDNETKSDIEYRLIEEDKVVDKNSYVSAEVTDNIGVTSSTMEETEIHTSQNETPEIFFYENRTSYLHKQQLSEANLMDACDIMTKNFIVGDISDNPNANTDKDIHNHDVCNSEKESSHLINDCENYLHENEMLTYAFNGICRPHFDKQSRIEAGDNIWPDSEESGFIDVDQTIKERTDISNIHKNNYEDIIDNLANETETCLNVHGTSDDITDTNKAVDFNQKSAYETQFSSEFGNTHKTIMELGINLTEEIDTYPNSKIIFENRNEQEKQNIEQHINENIDGIFNEDMSNEFLSKISVKDMRQNKLCYENRNSVSSSDLTVSKPCEIVCSGTSVTFPDVNKNNFILENAEGDQNCQTDKERKVIYHRTNSKNKNNRKRSQKKRHSKPRNKETINRFTNKVTDSTCTIDHLSDTKEALPNESDDLERKELTSNDSKNFSLLNETDKTAIGIADEISEQMKPVNDTNKFEEVQNSSLHEMVRDLNNRDKNNTTSEIYQKPVIDNQEFTNKLNDSITYEDSYFDAQNITNEANYPEINSPLSQEIYSPVSDKELEPAMIERENFRQSIRSEHKSIILGRPYSETDNKIEIINNDNMEAIFEATPSFAIEPLKNGDNCIISAKETINSENELTNVHNSGNIIVHSTNEAILSESEKIAPTENIAVGNSLPNSCLTDTSSRMIIKGKRRIRGKCKNKEQTNCVSLESSAGSALRAKTSTEEQKRNRLIVDKEQTICDKEQTYCVILETSAENVFTVETSTEEEKTNRLIADEEQTNCNKEQTNCVSLELSAESVFNAKTSTEEEKGDRLIMDKEQTNCNKEQTNCVSLESSAESVSNPKINTEDENSFSSSIVNTHSLNEWKIQLAEQLPLKSGDTDSENSFSDKSSCQKFTEDNDRTRSPRNINDEVQNRSNESTTNTAGFYNSQDSHRTRYPGDINDEVQNKNNESATNTMETSNSFSYKGNEMTEKCTTNPEIDRNQFDPEKQSSATAASDMENDTEISKCSEIIRTRKTLTRLWRNEKNKQFKIFRNYRNDIKKKIVHLEKELITNGQSCVHKFSVVDIKDKNLVFQTVDGGEHFSSEMEITREYPDDEYEENHDNRIESWLQSVPTENSSESSKVLESSSISVEVSRDDSNFLYNERCFKEMVENSANSFNNCQSAVSCISNQNLDNRSEISKKGLNESKTLPTGSSEDSNFHFHQSTSPSDTSSDTSEESGDNYSRHRSSTCFSTNQESFERLEVGKDKNTSLEMRINRTANRSCAEMSKTHGGIKWISDGNMISGGANSQAMSSSSTSHELQHTTKISKTNKITLKNRNKNSEIDSESDHMVQESRNLSYSTHANSLNKHSDGMPSDVQLNSEKCESLTHNYDVEQNYSQKTNQTDPLKYHLRYKNLDLHVLDSSPSLTIRLIDENDGSVASLTPRWQRFVNSSLSSSNSSINELQLPSSMSSCSTGETVKENINISQGELKMSVEKSDSEKTSISSDTHKNLTTKNSMENIAEVTYIRDNDVLIDSENADKVNQNKQQNETDPSVTSECNESEIFANKHAINESVVDNSDVPGENPETVVQKTGVIANYSLDNIDVRGNGNFIDSENADKVSQHKNKADRSAMFKFDEPEHFVNKHTISESVANDNHVLGSEKQTRPLAIALFDKDCDEVSDTRNSVNLIDSESAAKVNQQKNKGDRSAMYEFQESENVTNKHTINESVANNNDVPGGRIKNAAKESGVIANCSSDNKFAEHYSVRYELSETDANNVTDININEPVVNDNHVPGGNTETTTKETEEVANCSFKINHNNSAEQYSLGNEIFETDANNVSDININEPAVNYSHVPGGNSETIVKETEIVASCSFKKNHNNSAEQCSVGNEISETDANNVSDTNINPVGISENVSVDTETAVMTENTYSKDFQFEAKGIKLTCKPSCESDSVEVKFRQLENKTKLTFKSGYKKLYLKMSGNT